jgi:hypothetical protein
MHIENPNRWPLSGTGNLIVILNESTLPNSSDVEIYSVKLFGKVEIYSVKLRYFRVHVVKLHDGLFFLLFYYRLVAGL